MKFMVSEHRVRRAVPGLIAMVVLCDWTPSAMATDVPAFCDAALAADVQRRNLDEFERYQPRGGNSKTSRCEGTYDAKHSRTEAVLSGVWRDCGSATPPSAHNSTLVLGWQPGAPTDIHTRVQSFGDQRLYEMDTGTARDVTSFAWPQKLVQKLGLDPQKLMARSWFDEDGLRVYLPVRWSATEPTGCHVSYRLDFDTVPDGPWKAAVSIKRVGPSYEATLAPSSGPFDRGHASIRIDPATLPSGGTYIVEVKFDQVRLPSLVALLHGVPATDAGAGP